MYEEYKKGLSLGDIEKIFGITRQSIYIGFKRRNNDIKNLKMMKKDEHTRKYATGNNQYTKKEV